MPLLSYLKPESNTITSTLSPQDVATEMLPSVVIVEKDKDKDFVSSEFKVASLYIELSTSYPPDFEFSSVSFVTDFD